MGISKEVKELLNKTSNKATKIENYFKQQGIDCYIVSSVWDNEGVMDIHALDRNLDKIVGTFMYVENIDEDIYYKAFKDGNNNKKYENTPEEKFVLLLLKENNISLSVLDYHVLSFEYTEDNSIDLDTVTEIKYDREENCCYVESIDIDNATTVIDFEKKELRYILHSDDKKKQLSFDEYLYSLDIHIKDEIEEYETNDLIKFIDWMQEFNEQGDYKLIIQNKHITQVYKQDKYQFCAIEDIVKYYKTILENGQIELGIDFTGQEEDGTKYMETWNISQDFGFKM